MNLFWIFALFSDKQQPSYKQTQLESELHTTLSSASRFLQEEEKTMKRMHRRKWLNECGSFCSQIQQMAD